MKIKDYLEKKEKEFEKLCLELKILGALNQKGLAEIRSVAVFDQKTARVELIANSLAELKDYFYLFDPLAVDMTIYDEPDWIRITEIGTTGLGEPIAPFWITKSYTPFAFEFRFMFALDQSRVEVTIEFERGLIKHFVGFTTAKTKDGDFWHYWEPNKQLPNKTLADVLKEGE